MIHATISRMIACAARQRWKLVSAAIAVLCAANGFAQSQVPRYRQAHVMPATLSTSRPTDSLGETVYEFLKPNQQGVSPVAGVFMTPVPLQTPVPEYPESMRRAKKDGNVVVEGVVTNDGRFIDLKAVTASDPAFIQNAIDVVGKYVFDPATLDGKPVACLLKVEVSFTIFSGPRRP